MAKKRKTQIVPEILPPAPATPQPITETIEKNYMPYVMSVIVSRAIPEIDGFKLPERRLPAFANKRLMLVKSILL